MTPKVSLRAALGDPQLLGHELQGESFHAWHALLLGAMGEELTESELAIFTKLTGREVSPTERVEELLVVAGRRGGKSLASSVLAVYLACLTEHRALRRGEKGIVLCISPDLRQSRVVRNYCEGILQASPILSRMVINSTADSIVLDNGVTIECRSASFRRLRCMTCVGVVCDETCFWQSDETSSNPDSEILGAVRPALSTTHGPLCIISTPYARRGETWRLLNENFGPDGDPAILVASAASRDLNPTLSEKVVARALERDPQAAAAEFLGQWRSDVASFIDRRAVAACIEADCFERMKQQGWQYHGFVDPSGGSSDSFTLAIAHLERDGRVVVDAVRERKPPFSPAEVVHEFSRLLDLYNITEIRGDQYSGEFVRELFSKRGITYRLSEKTKSELFLDFLPSLNSRQVSLLDNDRLVSQLCALERKTGFSGKDQVGHPQGQHDDVANAVAGVAWHCQFRQLGIVRIGSAKGFY